MLLQAELTLVEQGVMAIFQRLRATRTLAQRMFDELPFSHVEVVRALEDLEQRHRFLIRETDEGNDWLTLTSEGAVAARLPVSGTATSDASAASHRP